MILRILGVSPVVAPTRVRFGADLLRGARCPPPPAACEGSRPIQHGGAGIRQVQLTPGRSRPAGVLHSQGVRRRARQPERAPTPALEAASATPGDSEESLRRGLTLEAARRAVRRLQRALHKRAPRSQGRGPRALF